MESNNKKQGTRHNLFEVMEVYYDINDYTCPRRSIKTV